VELCDVVKKRYNIAVVDDELQRRRYIRSSLVDGNNKYRVRTYFSGRHIIEDLDRHNLNFAVIELGLRDICSLELYRRLKLENGRLGVIFVSSLIKYCTDASFYYGNKFSFKPENFLADPVCPVELCKRVEDFLAG
jgi:CheY-like chemotaxis protein